MTADKIKEVKDVYSARSKSKSVSSKPFFVGLISKLDKKKVIVRR